MRWFVVTLCMCLTLSNSVKPFFDNIDRPSSRVATATRKLQLVNDSQAKSFGIHNVHCASCNRDVDLGHAIDYDLTKWEDHKTQCHW